MKHRQIDDETLFVTEFEQLFYAEDIGKDIAVAQHRTFWLACCARCVDDDGRVVDIHVLGQFFVGFEIGEDFVEGDVVFIQAVVFALPKNLLHFRAAEDVAQLLGKIRAGCEYFGFAVVKDKKELLLF